MSPIISRDSKIISLQALKDIEAELRDHGFIRVHKSFIVNRNYVELLDGNKLIVKGREIPLGTSYKDQAIKRIF